MTRSNETTTKINNNIGAKIKELRLINGLSRQQLTDQIGVTHQQLQKYESGVNRVSAGRLVLIANALGVDIIYFYEGCISQKVEVIDKEPQRLCLEVSRNFLKIKSKNQREAISRMIKSLIDVNI